MSRPVAGLACRVRVPVRQYQAVAVVIGDEHHVIRLMHRDAGLSIDVEQFKTLETAEEYRDRLAGFLNLPPMVMSGAPAPRDSAEDSPPQPRRRAACRRRPRFLTRRRPGAASPLGKVAGREIIARN
jgi:hypothetical protein